ncbi:MAG: multicopper oxidase domain-containing protein [Acidimicrobiales bacterium]
MTHIIDDEATPPASGDGRSPGSSASPGSVSVGADQSAGERLDGGPTPIEQIRLDELEREFERSRVSRAGWNVLIGMLALLAMLGSGLGVAFGLRAIDKSEQTAASGGPSEITASLSEFRIDLSSPSVGEGGRIAIDNAGSQLHNLAIRDTEVKSDDVLGGASTSMALSGLAAGSYELYCTIAGHAQAGMVAPITIGAGAGTASGAAAGSGATHGGHDMTGAEGAAQDQAMITSIAKFPAETKGKGNELLVPEVLADATKRFELTAAIVDWEVSPGKVVKAWTYNGMVPGPRLNLEVGDKVQVEITNKLPLGTDIHWHGIDVPNDQDGVAPITQDLVKPGESYTYNFTLTETGIGMYHAHAHADLTVPNGMFGTIYVGQVPMPVGRTISGIAVPADLKLTQDFPMVLNDAGVIGLTLDGKSFPATAPVVAKVGDWFRVTYFNEGLMVHPMHLHGFEQLVVAKDGEPLDAPYAADTVLVAPGERYTVLVHANAPGTWVWHCHILNHVESPEGMFGMVTAVVVNGEG